MTFDEAATAYSAISRKYSLNASFSCNNGLRRHAFFRGRAGDPSNLRPAQNVFSYPPAKFCRTYGRANVPLHPVFYAAETPQTVAEEVRLPDGAWLHLAVFYTPHPVEMRVMPFFHSAFTAENEWSEMRDAFKQFVEKEGDVRFGTDPVPLRSSNIERLALAFRGDDYTETAILGHYWLSNPRTDLQVDAIVYPSVRRDDTCNLAIAPRFVDAHLALFRVFLCHFVGGEFRVKSVGELSADGLLAWRQPNDDDSRHWIGGFEQLIEADR